MQVHSILAALVAPADTSKTPYPKYTHLLDHPHQQRIARTFIEQAACMLRRSGLPQRAAEASALAPNRVPVWPQVMSYGSEALMPSGRESTLAETLMRGIYVVDANAEVEVVLYDPRGPLDAMEVQDAVDGMYRCASADRRQCT